ncbi:ElyC/SanA/YdcF family protein [Prochlorococcus marinus]|uniref:ElyC/SanA/YdcF family protein n=1 Tax=Prochlorococcus marinus TaxID=1219 RepID=UPI0022B3ECC0|nr:ElyC/SanA/YdcF family protein [Prochlorococcus marinus]
MSLRDRDLRELKAKNRRYKVSVGNGIYVEVYPNGGKYLLWKYHFPSGRKGQQRWYQIGPYGNSDGQWTIKNAQEEKDRLDVLRKEGIDPRLNKLSLKVKRKSQLICSNNSINPVKNLANIKEKIIAELIEFRDISNDLGNQVVEKDLCYIILGHEIDQKTFELSTSGKNRCKVLAQQIKSSLTKKYCVFFMGLGRLQGKCKLSISECMFKYFSDNYFIPEQYVLEKRSLDTVGDAVFSYELLNFIGFTKHVCVVTSDWHLKRSKVIFKKIFDSRFKLSFCATSELDDMAEMDKIKINNNEEKSIKLFRKQFKNYNPKQLCASKFLKINHLLYNKN